MQPNTFSLCGLGYLRDVIQNGGEKIAKICVIHQFNSGFDHTDEIWINCLVREFKLRSKIKLVERSLELGHAVIIQFEAKYLGLEHTQFGVTEQDPHQFLQFKADLLRVHNMYINGNSVNLDDEPVKLLK